jgi:peroxiredoxin
MSEGTAATTPQPTTHGPRPSASAGIPATLVPEAGWHFLHMYYRIDRAALAELSDSARLEGSQKLVEALTRREGSGVEGLHSFVVPGHKADFGFMAAGPDLKAVRQIQTEIQASPLGPALVPTYSFYSITEISEYVPSAEQYGEVLVREGVDPESPTYKTKVASYTQRLGPMNKQRLYPEFPDWPCLCFYPMSKMRLGDQNWYLLPFEARAELMSQHGKSGMRFAGKVSQVITASTGLDDWEWGVTLWAKNPSYIKDIVYTMRFDESSAKYALFGPFYFGYILPPAELPGAIRL